jgi:hypothetical protein
MAMKVRRVFGQTQAIGATKQHEKDAYQVQHFTLGDRQVTVLGEHFINLRHRPPFPEPPVANLGNDLQRKTAAAHGQMAGRLRGIDLLVPGAFRMGTMVTHADNQITTIQKDHVFSPERIAALQDAPTTRARHLFWPIVTLGNIAIIFGSSHRHTSLAQGSWKSLFYSARSM